MSFFRKKKVDFLEQEKAIDREIAIANTLAKKARAEEEPALREGEVRIRNIETDTEQVISEETSKERNRMKYKDTSGLATSHEKNSYPTFNVFYLGRIPTNIEYGLEAVEGPVDQLCRMRDQQKLPKVAITFDTEGLTIKETSSTLFSKNKNKKDGIDVHLPLHHITYGVACEGHPLVFACVSRLAEDDTPHDGGMPVLMLYAFLCDKTDTAQKITYWQLQAYIEAYEELKRKKILRNRRKQALGSRNSSHNRKEEIIHKQPLPMYGNEPPPPMEEEEEEEEEEKEENANIIPKKGYKVKNKDYSKPKASNGYIPESDAHVASNPTEDSSPTEKTRSGSTTSEESQSGSRDVAFERRITEMNDLMVEMDAEKLKKLMISNHASLAREIYFNKTNPSRISSDPNEGYDDGKDNSNV